MGNSKLKSRHVVQLGFPKGELAGLAMQVLEQHFRRESQMAKINILKDLLANPAAFAEDERLGVLAKKLMPPPADPEPVRVGRSELRVAPLPYGIWDGAGIEPHTLEQMDLVMRLPVVAGGALMPDAHKGIGLPVGGVIATRNAVIPYAVGMDIGCRMALSVFAVDGESLQNRERQLVQVLQDCSRFGSDHFEDLRDDPVLHRPEFSEIPIARNLRERARRQIGSSGSGNHFVEFGQVVLPEQNEMGLPAGTYLGLLTHSGSRGFGAGIGEWYGHLAKRQLKLPKEAKYLAWLDLDSPEGMEYWAAMQLAGDYASACHRHIHERVVQATGFEMAYKVENHHNFAWKQVMADGTEVVIHRKGATPAESGTLGIIPGSMTAPGFVVRGLGKPEAWQSASHGAGRAYSRAKVANSFTRSAFRNVLRANGVTLLGGGLEESPFAYKNIHAVMAAQTDLVEVLAEFHPKIVRMDRN